MTTTAKSAIAICTALLVWFAVSTLYAVSALPSQDEEDKSPSPQAPSSVQLQPYIEDMVESGKLSQNSLVYVVPGCSTCAVLPNPQQCPGGLTCYLILGDYPMFNSKPYKDKLLVDVQKVLLPKNSYQGFDFGIYLKDGNVKQVFRRGFVSFAEMEKQLK